MKPDYSLVRSKRKTVALFVQADGSLLVRAPVRVSLNLIDSFVTSKEQWIKKQRQKITSQISRQQEEAIIQSSSILYLGKHYPVEVVEQQEMQLIFDGNKFFAAKINMDNFASMVEAWSRHQARQILKDRVYRYARAHHFEPKDIRITAARTRWGSCSTRGRLSFSWRLVMAPIEVIDYVVVHELVHLLEKNHQKSFWAKVALILPDYESRRKWLKTNGVNIMSSHTAKDY